ncbi:restriction endonuclease [Bacillus thuringiensis]|uniref:restriction endonuclease n=1 Tax=Bacillus thuringiensis TaxID=1428 RepID=UPI003DA178AF
MDVFVSKNDITYAVQAKSYTKSVPNSVIQEVVAGMQFYDADESIGGKDGNAIMGSRKTYTYFRYIEIEALRTRENRIN